MSKAASSSEGQGTVQINSRQGELKRGISPSMPAGVGLVLTALAIGAVMATARMDSAPSDRSQLSFVAQSEITDAATTLVPQTASALVGEAKRCTIPLASLVVSKSMTGGSGTIRIRSGSYLSPPFLLTDMPQRVAVPFPGPYPSGMGTITIEGNATGSVISLSPAVKIDKLAGANSIPVWWTPRKPC
jgi:hypothetical protein